MQEQKYVKPIDLPGEIEMKGLDGHTYINPRSTPPAEAVRLAKRHKRKKWLKPKK